MHFNSQQKPFIASKITIGLSQMARVVTLDAHVKTPNTSRCRQNSQKFAEIGQCKRQKPPLRTALALFHRSRAFKMLFRSGSDLLSHVLRRSTISATVLNGRVRDGIGCFTCAMTTKPKKHFEIHESVYPNFCPV